MRAPLALWSGFVLAFTTLSYTLETPSAFPLAQRIATMRAAVETALRLSTRVGQT